MGMLIEGKWHYSDLKPRTVKGEFKRNGSKFRSRISRDPDSDFPPEEDRYHLYISLACPWACRCYIMHKLKSLKGVVGISIVDPHLGSEGWHFSDREGCIPDTVNHSKYLRELYQLADYEFTGRVTVPVLWDRHQHTIVNNESSDIMRIFNSEFNELTGNQADYYPPELKATIDAINEKIYEAINNGVYKCGFATTQKAYDKAYDELFTALGEIEALLGKRRYLAGNVITGSDWRLFTTLVRFDAVYHYHFKCNKRRIIDYPNLQNYLVDLYNQPGIPETVNMKHIKEHYYLSHSHLNPSGIIPKGPELYFERPATEAKSSG